MRILFVAPRFHTNQVGIIESFLDAGWKVFFDVATIGATEDHSTVVPYRPPNSAFSTKVGRLFGGRGPNNKQFCPRIVPYIHRIRSLQPDLTIIRVHGKCFPYLAAAAAAWSGSRVLFYRQLPANLIWHIWKRPLQRLRFWFPLWLFRGVFITPLCDTDSEKLPPRCYFLPFVVPIAATVEKARVQNVRILIVGKYQPRKNHCLMLQAMKYLDEQVSISATFIGEVSTDQHRSIRAAVEAEAVSLGLRGNVRFIDNLPHRRMTDMYRKHDIFVLPASNEPASVSVVEALGQGLPVICSDTCGTSSYIRAGYNGAIFVSGDTGSLANAIRSVIYETGRLDEMRRNALSFATSHASSEAYLMRLKELMIKEFKMSGV